jgi:hypothetical protein
LPRFFGTISNTAVLQRLRGGTVPQPAVEDDAELAPVGGDVPNSGVKT